MRLDRNLEADISGIYQNKEGDTGDDVWGKRSAWVVLNGKIKDEKISIALIDHPENPNYPGWSHARGYGLFAINNLGGQCFDKQAEKVQILLKEGFHHFYPPNYDKGRRLSFQSGNRKGSCTTETPINN